MIIRNMRWGCDGGGVGCGPVEPSYMVETLVSDENEHNYFILCSRFTDSYRVDIAEIPLFDLMMYAPLGLSFEHELKKIEKAAIEEYNFEKEETFDEDDSWDEDAEDTDDDDEEYEDDEDILEDFDVFDCPEMFQSRFANAIKLTLAAMEQCWGSEAPNDQDAKEFVEKYLGEDVNKIDITI